MISKKARPLILSLAFGLTSVVLGQQALRLEKERALTDYCESVNLHNIILFSRVRDSIELRNDEFFDVDLPIVCQALPGIANQAVPAVSIGGESRLTRLENELDSYAVELNKLDDGKARLQRNIILGLLLFNVVALLLQAVHLYEDSKDIDEHE
ncbi:MAG: hypothetical protein CMM03_03670 [Rhodopirellula sp.]|nr:hypothetical protein [Rhodopirellula sp.]|tara:strand:- start:1382 stop:1843 length:462 start_codon:yes stop_codon:yes gene_type:complete